MQQVRRHQLSGKTEPKPNLTLNYEDASTSSLETGFGPFFIRREMYILKEYFYILKPTHPHVAPKP